MKEVVIYTDGACSGNPGPGGWCAILTYKENEKVVSGYYPDTTNNRMEMMAVICGLKQLKEQCSVKVYSDSSYIVDSISLGRLDSWIKNNWKLSSKEPVKNADLWKALLIELDKHKVEFIKVKGHSDDEYNNRCDQIARKEITDRQKNSH
ncbi:MAG: ribonuclease HI [Clostridia bacterium]|nr:ribonuclease HI [Clostridia bacterium]